MPRTNAREHPEAGFTVVELTVTMGILLVLTTAMLSVFSVVQRSSIRQSARSESADEMRLVMERLTKEVRQASEINSGSDGDTLDMDTYEDGVAARIVYTAAGSTLSRTEGTATRVVLERLVSTAVFSYLPDATAPSSILVTLRARPRNFSTDSAELTLSSEVKLRNEGEA